MICSPSLATSASKISPSEQFQPNIRLIYSTKISHDRLAIPRDQNTHTHTHIPTYTKRSPSFFLLPCRRVRYLARTKPAASRVFPGHTVSRRKHRTYTWAAIGRPLRRPRDTHARTVRLSFCAPFSSLAYAFLSRGCSKRDGCAPCWALR